MFNFLNIIITSMVTEKAINSRIIEIMKAHGVIEPIRKIGGSYGLILPLPWVEEYCLCIEDSEGQKTYWTNLYVEVENGKGYIKCSFPNKDEVLDFLSNIATGEDKTTKKMFFTDEEIIDTCNQMLKARNLPYSIRKIDEQW